MAGHPVLYAKRIYFLGRFIWISRTLVWVQSRSALLFLLFVMSCRSIHMLGSWAIRLAQQRLGTIVALSAVILIPNPARHYCIKFNLTWTRRWPIYVRTYVRKVVFFSLQNMETATSSSVFLKEKIVCIIFPASQPANQPSQTSQSLIFPLFFLFIHNRFPFLRDWEKRSSFPSFFNIRTYTSSPSFFSTSSLASFLPRKLWAVWHCKAVKKNRKRRCWRKAGRTGDLTGPHL